jgi:hypothetical protein
VLRLRLRLRLRLLRSSARLAIYFCLLVVQQLRPEQDQEPPQTHST